MPTRLARRGLLLACFLVVGCSVVVAGCARPPAKELPQRPPAPAVDLAAALDNAIAAEARTPASYEAYLRVLEHAVLQRDDAWAPAAAVTALDALVWQTAHPLPGRASAVVYRSQEAFATVAKRLRALWPRARHMPLLGGLIASALHDLALRVGVPKTARRWRRRAGCVARATVVGPLGAPPLVALARPTPIAPKGRFAATFAGVAPFARMAARVGGKVPS